MFKVLGKLKNTQRHMKNEKSYALDSWVVKAKGSTSLGNKLPKKMFLCVGGRMSFTHKHTDTHNYFFF